MNISEEHRHLSISLPEGRKVEVDLYEELAIDENNLRLEIINQPAKYAKWATFYDLSCIKVDTLEGEKIQFQKVNLVDECPPKLIQEYQKAVKQKELLGKVRRAVYHRKDTLFDLLDRIS